VALWASSGGKARLHVRSPRLLSLR
jgi:hypothetical protein